MDPPEEIKPRSLRCQCIACSCHSAMEVTDKSKRNVVYFKVVMVANRLKVNQLCVLWHFTPFWMISKAKV